MNRQKCGIAGLLIVAVGLANLQLLAQSPQAGHAAPPSGSPDTTTPDVKTHTVEKGDLALHLEREGRIDSAHRIKVRLVPEAFNGPFEIEEIAIRGGKVDKGDVIMRFDDEPYAKELDAARMNLDHARRRLQIGRDEQRVLQEANAVRLEQTAKAMDKAAKELAIWEQYDGPDMLRTTELSLQQRGFSLADEKQELAQLEEMYKGTHLAGETKDIVLDRARRGVMMSAAWLTLAKNDDLVVHQYRHPLQDMAVRDAARWTTQEDAHARINAAAAEQRKTMELETADRALRDAEERLVKLEADQALLVVAAPIDGVMTKVELEPKDTINPRQTICEILDPSKLVVKFNATAEDMRIIGGEDELKLAILLPEYPDIHVAGVVDELADIGAAADQATHFPVVVALQGDGADVRIGMRCKVHSSRVMKDVLTVPVEAVTWEQGRASCTVQRNGEQEKVELTVGPTGGKMIAVNSGLAAGDQVILDAADAK